MTRPRITKPDREQFVFCGALVLLGIALYRVVQTPEPESLIAFAGTLNALLADHLPATTTLRPVASGQPTVWNKVSEDFDSTPWGPVQPVINDEVDALPPAMRNKLNEQRRNHGYEPPHVDRFHFASPVLAAEIAPFSLSLSKNLDAWICVYVVRTRFDKQELIRVPSNIGGSSEYGGTCILGRIDDPVQVVVCVFPLTKDTDSQLEAAKGLYPCGWSDSHIELCASHVMELE